MIRRLAALSLVAAVACGPSGGPSETNTPTPQPTSVGSPQPTEPAEEARVIRLSVRDGRVVGVEGTVEVKLGETVMIAVTSDRSDQLHVHGYDIILPLTAGLESTVDFPADIPGVFEVELEESRLPLFKLKVS